MPTDTIKPTDKPKESLSIRAATLDETESVTYQKNWFSRKPSIEQLKNDPFGHLKVKKRTTQSREQLIAGLTEEQNGYKAAIESFMPALQEVTKIASDLNNNYGAFVDEMVKSHNRSSFHQTSPYYYKRDMEGDVGNKYIKNGGAFFQKMNRFEQHERSINQLNSIANLLLKGDEPSPGMSEEVLELPKKLQAFERLLTALASTPQDNIPDELKADIRKLHRASDLMCDSIMPHFIGQGPDRPTETLKAMAAYAHRGNYEKREMIKRNAPEVIDPAGR